MTEPTKRITRPASHRFDYMEVKPLSVTHPTLWKKASKDAAMVSVQNMLFIQTCVNHIQYYTVDVAEHERAITMAGLVGQELGEGLAMNRVREAIEKLEASTGVYTMDECAHENAFSIFRKELGLDDDEVRS
jgi:hypothetical protein